MMRSLKPPQQSQFTYNIAKVDIYFASHGHRLTVGKSMQGHDNITLERIADTVQDVLSEQQWAMLSKSTPEFTDHANLSRVRVLDC